MNELSQHIVSAPVVILTGAGASVHLGKPTTAEFVGRVYAELALERGHEEERIWVNVLRSCRERWASDAVDVEMILEQLSGQVKALDRLGADYNLREGALSASRVYDYYKGLERRILALVVEEYCDVRATKAKGLYQPLFTGLAAQLSLRTLPVFTLNYDVAVERATSQLNVRLVDGVRRAVPADNRWSAREFHGYAPRDDLAVVLFKLHGSTTWAWDRDDSLVELPFGTGKDPGKLRHAVLYPYLTQKDLEKEPFKTGYAYLEACLARAEWLVIIGTSLRDQRLVEILQGAVVTNPSLAVALVDPSLDADGLAEILQPTPRVIRSVKAGFTPETAAKVWRHVTENLPRARPPSRRGRRSATSPALASP
jgi:hypothetical protein